MRSREALPVISRTDVNNIPAKKESRERSALLIGLTRRCQHNESRGRGREGGEYKAAEVGLSGDLGWWGEEVED